MYNINVLCVSKHLYCFCFISSKSRISKRRCFNIRGAGQKVTRRNSTPSFLHMRTNSTPSICTCGQIVPYGFSRADKQYSVFLHRLTNSTPSVNFLISLEVVPFIGVKIICHTVLRIRPFVHSYWVDSAIIVGNKWMSPVLSAIVNTFWSAAQLVRNEKRLIQCLTFGSLNISWIKVLSILARVLFFTPSYFNFNVKLYCFSNYCVFQHQYTFESIITFSSLKDVHIIRTKTPNFYLFTIEFTVKKSRTLLYQGHTYSKYRNRCMYNVYLIHV